MLSTGWLNWAVQLDFERDIAPKAKFFADDLDLELDEISEMFSLSAELADQDLNDLKARTEYLRSKAFTKADIARIVSREPFWLTYSIEEIDGRLGFIQNFFKFNGDEVRNVASNSPALVIWAGIPAQIRFNAFALREQCGFSEDECKRIALKAPEVFKSEEEAEIVDRFRLLHLEAGFSHELLAKSGGAAALGHSLEVPLPRLEARIKFLKAVGRDKFDPKQPNFVSPEALFLGDDQDFCINVAKVSVSTFNQFCKTL